MLKKNMFRGKTLELLGFVFPFNILPNFFGIQVHFYPQYEFKTSHPNIPNYNTSTLHTLIHHTLQDPPPPISYRLKE